MNVKEFINKNITILDGGMGTLLQAAGLAPRVDTATTVRPV